MSAKLLAKGIYAIGFFYPVVTKGKARIRTQISAIHTQEDLDKAITAFTSTRTEMAS
jgi:glycine C-acetyltransferase